MIKKLQIKFVAILMSVVTIILLAIFFTMLIASKHLNEQLSSTILQQALTGRPHVIDIKRPNSTSPTDFIKRNPNRSPNPITLNSRRPVLVFEVDEVGNISSRANQLHFLGDNDIDAIAKLIVNEPSDNGTLTGYYLRYLKQPSSNGFRIAVVDISVEQEALRTQITNSLITGGAAFVIFLLLSIFLSRLAIRPVKIAWQNQKQFVSDASHELKTPLAVILANIDMLQKDSLDNDAKSVQRMDHINAEATRMKLLVEDMLSLAKSDDSVEHVSSLLNFSYLIKDVALMYEPISFDEHKILTFDIEDNLCLYGDARQLQQLAHILLDNARKYSSSSGTINVSLAKLDAHNLQLLISNTGSPIPENELKKIFLRFYRRNQSRSEHGSFGLGLSIAQNIVAEHNGKIWAKSNSQGNHFHVTLPLA